MKKKFRNISLFARFSSKLIVSFILLASVPIIAVGVFLIGTTQTFIEASIFEENIRLAKRSSNEIKIYVNTGFSVLSTVATVPSLTNMNTFEQSFIINRLKQDNEELFKRILILDSSGVEILNTSFSPRKAQYNNEYIMEQVKNGSTFFSPVYIDENLSPAMFVGVPIVKFHTVVGALVVEIDLKSIWDLVDGIRIGQLGGAFIVSESGKLIAHRDKERVYRGEVIRIPQLFGDPALTGQTFRFRDANGTEMIAAYAPIDDLNWRIVIERPFDEAFAVSDKLRFQMMIVMLLSISIASLIGLFMTRKINEPVQNLVAGAKQFSEGDLDHKIINPGKDEFASLAKEFNHMAENLSKIQKRLTRTERYETMSRFASVVSHEIRNPLNSITINLQILKRYLTRVSAASDSHELDQELKYMNIIESEIRRVDALIKDFLTVSRPPELFLKKVDINKLIDQIVMSEQGRALSSGIRIERNLSAVDTYVDIDADQIRQALLNIMINSFQAMPGGGKLIIATRNVYKDDTRMLSLEITDNGKGIEADKINNIFEFYFTTKKDGTGLGLPIAQQIIERHNGEISIESKTPAESGGRRSETSVTIILPCALFPAKLD